MTHFNPDRQGGVALLVLLSLVMVAVATALIRQVSLNKSRLDRQAGSLAALTAAKDNLLAYAVRQNPPGLLPCPDTDGDGFSNLTGVVCSAQLGRLPWRTLQSDELLDAASERLWYAVELGYTRVAPAVNLNSSLASALRLNTSQVVAAVVLAPGAAINGQLRNNQNANQFLEGVNSDGNTQTYALARSDTNNDELLGLDNREFWTTIERRVVFEAGEALAAYWSTASCQQYPWAALNIAPYNSSAGRELGWLPVGAAQAWNAAPGCPAALTLPAWLATHWGGQLYYAFCGPSGAACLSLSGDVTSTAEVLLMAPGMPLSGQIRPSAALNNYFESGNNDADYQFVYRNPRNHSDTFNDLFHLFTP